MAKKMCKFNLRKKKKKKKKKKNDKKYSEIKAYIQTTCTFSDHNKSICQVTKNQLDTHCLYIVEK